MSDPISVRVTLDSYDLVHPSEKQTQVYVQIPEVGRASWLLDASFYAVLKDEPWPHVVDEAHNDYMRRGVVSDSTSEAARQAIVDWLLLSEGADYDARYDAVQAAWELDQARRHPVARKLLAENERLTARVAGLEAALRLRNTQRGDVAQLVERERGFDEECVDIDDVEAALMLGADEPAHAAPCRWPSSPDCTCDESPEDTPAALAAREIQALDDPAVIGYTIGDDSLTLMLRPSSEAEWSAWQARLSCDIGSATYRGGHATAHGCWGAVDVHVVCVLDGIAGPGAAS